MNKKELLWFLGTLLLVFVVYFGILGFDDFNLLGDTDINMGDTYYVLPAWYLLVFLGAFVFFTIYIVRVLHGRFKNKVANIVFILSDILLIVCFTGLISIVSQMRELPGTTVYPPLSSPPIKHTGNIWNVVYYVLYGFQAAFLLLLVLTMFKSFRKCLGYGRE